MRRLFPLLALTLFLRAFSLHAQSPEDILLSHNPNDSTLSTDLQIQAALEHGGHRLAVWGTQVADGDSVVGALMMNLDGVQSVLTSSDARPYGAVDIVPMGSEDFLVMWNDRREGGKSMRGVKVSGRSGVRGGDLLLENGLDFFGRVIYRANPNSMRIIFTTMSSGQPLSRMIMLSSLGSPLAGSIVISDSEILSASSYLIPDGSLLVRLKDQRALLIDDEGIVENPLLNQGLLNHPHYFDDAGGIVLYVDDTVRYYRSYRQQQPDSILPLQLPRSDSYPDWKALAIHHDSLGWYLACLSTSLKRSGDFIEITRMNLRFTFSAPEDTSMVKQVLVLAFVPPGASSVTTDKSVSISFGEVNVVSVQIGGTFSYDPHGSSQITTGSLGASFAIGSLPMNPTARSFGAARTGSHRTSSISVAWKSNPAGKVIYSSAIAPLRLTLGQLRPALLVGESIQVGWRSTSGLFGSGFLPSVDGLVSRDPYPTASIANISAFSSGLESQPSLPVALAASATYSLPSSRNPYHSNGISVVLHRLWPTGGWRGIELASFHNSGINQPPVTPLLHTPSFDPNTNRVITMIGFPWDVATPHGFPLQNFRAIGLGDSSRPISWSSSISGETLGFVPITGNQVFLLKDQNTLERYSGNAPMRPGVRMRSVDAEAGERTILLQRLFGEYLLRMTFTPERRTRTLEVYNFFGRMEAQREIPAIPSARGIAVVLNPADSSIILIEASNSGVIAVPFGKNLQSMMTVRGEKIGAVTISRTSDSTAYPAAVIDDGNIFVAWEDYRDSDSIGTIRGNWWRLPQMIAAEDSFDPYDPDYAIPFVPASVVSIRMVSPHPFLTGTNLVVNALDAYPAIITLYNARGEAVYATEVELRDGENAYPLNLPPLDGGVYHLRVQAGGDSDDLPVIVLGE